jgi:uroporphyrinogen-III decarboxylase
MAINRKKARRQRQRAREQFKTRGERQLLQRIETALVQEPKLVFPDGHTTVTERMSSSQVNTQNLPRQCIIDKAEEYRKQYRAQQGLE